MIKVELLERGVYGADRKKVGPRWQVQLMVSEGMASDGMWSSLTHAARIGDLEVAKRFRDQVEAAVRKAQADHAAGRPVQGWGGINLDHWTWFPSKACPFLHLQQPPTAVEYDVL